MASPWKEQRDKFKDIDDEELIDEIDYRGLMDSLQYSYDISHFSDEQIIQEFEFRELDKDNPDFIELHELMHQGLPYEEFLKELIHKYTGRIL